MKPKYSNLFAGIVLILLGAFIFTEQMGYVQELSPRTGMLVFAFASLFFLAIYFLNGIQKWGWLFPAFIFAALSGVLAIVSAELYETLIPALILSSIAIPFLVAFLLNHSRRWALIPFFILALIGLVPALSNMFNGDAMGSLILGMLGVSFLVAYFTIPSAWWGIIPAGFFLSISVMIAANNFIDGSLSVALMFSGWALTSIILWKRHRLQLASFFAIALIVLTGIMLLISVGLQSIIPVLSIMAGLGLVYLAWRPRAILVEK
ncbi:MAG: hypothetical protein HZB50_02510 [Chloroflexi bacterium]|nr:hypothetical protein [Chloroflexota bacterium]